MKDAIIVLSGGLDSTTMLYEYRDEIALAVSFDYGSNHNKRELAFAQMHCQRLGIRWICISLDFIHQYFHSSLLEGADQIPDGQYDDQNMRSTVVPFRNGIMLSIAAGLAENYQLQRVMIANHAGDHAIYPDCRPEFIDAISQSIVAGTYTRTKVYAPYTTLTKADIARHGKALSLNYAETWSCYKGGEKHCGVCGTCTERKQALAEAGIEDTTEYLQ